MAQHERGDVDPTQFAERLAAERPPNFFDQLAELVGVPQMLEGLSRQLYRMERNIMSELSDLQDAVAQNGQAIALAAQTLVDNTGTIAQLHDQLTALQGQGVDVTQLVALTAQVKQNNATIASALSPVIADPTTPTGDAPDPAVDPTAPADPGVPTTEPTTDPNTPSDPAGPVLDPTGGSGSGSAGSGDVPQVDPTQPVDPSQPTDPNDPNDPNVVPLPPVNDDGSTNANTSGPLDGPDAPTPDPNSPGQPSGF